MCVNKINYEHKVLGWQCWAIFPKKAQIETISLEITKGRPRSITIHLNLHPGPIGPTLFYPFALYICTREPALAVNELCSK